MTPQLIALIQDTGLPKELYPALQRAWDWQPKVSENSHPHDTEQMIKGNKPIVLTHRYQFMELLGEHAPEFHGLIAARGTTPDYDSVIAFRKENQDIAQLAKWASDAEKEYATTHFVLGLALGYPLGDIRTWIEQVPNLIGKNEVLQALQ